MSATEMNPEDHPGMTTVAALLPQDADRGLLQQFIDYLNDIAVPAADTTAPSPTYVEEAHARPEGHAAQDREPPFLSIVTRTQGKRPDTLREVFLTLSGQTCQDFEVVLVGHKLDEAEETMVRSMVSDLPCWLRDRVRLIKVDHGNRTTPLNAGFQASTGRYMAILDDDDFVFANWVEVFKDLGEANPGKILRTISLLQDFEEVTTNFGTKSSRAVSSPRSIYPLTFQLLDHLRENKSPPVALAFPRYYFSALGGRFDETLTTTEDWDYLMRAAFVCGVASAPTATSIYRQWVNRENSKTIHPPEEWIHNHHRIFDKHDNSPFLMEPGTTKFLRQLLDERDQLRAWAKHLDEELHSLRSLAPPAEILRLINEPEPNMPESAAMYRNQVAAILNSTSWKITKYLRMLKQVTSGSKIPPPDLPSLSVAELRVLHELLKNSTSWRVTSSLRKVAPLFRRFRADSRVTVGRLER